MADTYKVIRFFFKGPKRAVRDMNRLTLEEAKAHCKSPEASSKTATSSAARKRTAERGIWFDGYEKE